MMSLAGPLRRLVAVALAVAVFLHVPFDRFLRFPGTFLDAADEFVRLAFCKLEIVVRQIGPFLLELALEDVRVALGLCRSHSMVWLGF